MIALAITLALLQSGADGQVPAAQSDAPKPWIVACVQINDDGNVSKAFVVVSSGDAARDEVLLTAIEQLHWDKVPPGSNPSRNVWLPIGFALDGAAAPASPRSCGPAPNT
jgi:hypothetical protein